MEIRFLNKSDTPESVSYIYETSWKCAYKDIIPQSYLDNIEKGKWCKAIKNPDLCSLILLDHEKMIGTASYCPSRFMSMSGFGEIVSLYLLPEYCGQGYGNLLLCAAIDGLAKMGYKIVFLWVLEENRNARCFYEKFGFQNSGDCLKDNIGGKELLELRYIYTITKHETNE